MSSHKVWFTPSTVDNHQLTLPCPRCAHYHVREPKHLWPLQNVQVTETLETVTMSHVAYFGGRTEEIN